MCERGFLSEFLAARARVTMRAWPVARSIFDAPFDARFSCQTLSGPLPQSGSPAREARGAAAAAPQGCFQRENGPQRQATLLSLCGRNKQADNKLDKRLLSLHNSVARAAGRYTARRPSEFRAARAQIYIILVGCALFT